MLREVGSTLFSTSLGLTSAALILLFARWYCMIDMALLIISAQLISLILSLVVLPAMLHIIGPDDNSFFHTDETYCPEIIEEKEEQD